MLIQIFTAIACLLSTCSVLSAAERQPNIVLLVADDLGYGELGCQGNPQIPTPHIDSIANDGVRFTNGYVTAAFCSASRAGLMTGRYQTRFGYEFNPIGASNEDPNAGLPVKEQTLADFLQNVGYTTALIGKWHLGGTAQYHPQRRGFDEFFGFLHEGHYFVPPPYSGVTTMLRRKALPGNSKGRWISADGKTVYSTHMGHNEPDYDADNPLYKAGQPVEEQAYLTDALTREATSFIERSKDRPFFLYLAYNAVHSPLQGADGYMQKFSSIDDIHRRIFAAMLGNLDDSVGSVLDCLQQNGLDQDTLVFFISDNGGPTRELTSSNLPLRGEKGSMYEGGIRVPFMMRWPKQVPAGEVYENPVVSLDVFTTTTAAAGVGEQQVGIRDGVDLLPFLNDENTKMPHETLFWRTGAKAALRHRNWKLLRNAERQQPNDWRLFNLAVDVAEDNDLSVQNPAKLNELVLKWESLNSEMIAPIWNPFGR